MSKKFEENEDTKMWREIKEEKQVLHRQWKTQNMEVLKQSGLEFRVASEECILFRNPNLPTADFYPSTGRWRDMKTGRTYGGGARAFIGWYKRSKNAS